METDTYTIDSGLFRVSKWAAAIFAALIALIGLTAIADAQDAGPDAGAEITAAIDPIENPGDFFNDVLGAVQTSNWHYVAALGLVLVVALTSRYGSKVLPFLGVGKGKIALAIALGIAGGIATAVAAGGFGAVSFDVIATGLQVGLEAAGGVKAVQAIAGT